MDREDRNRSMNKSFMVIGIGRFGRAVALELEQSGVEVIAIDKNEEKVNRIADYVTMAAAVDVRDEGKLSKLGIANVDGIIICITADTDASAIAVMAGREAEVPYIFAKAKDELHQKMLKKLGADEVMVPECISGIRLARNLIYDNLKDVIEFSNRFQMLEIIPEREWIGKTLKELNIRQKMKMNVVAIRKNGEFVLQFDPAVPLKKEETLLVIKSL